MKEENKASKKQIDHIVNFAPKLAKWEAKAIIALKNGFWQKENIPSAKVGDVVLPTSDSEAV